MPSAYHAPELVESTASARRTAYMAALRSVGSTAVAARERTIQISALVLSSSTARSLALKASVTRESVELPGIEKPRSAAYCAERDRPAQANANDESRSIAREKSAIASATPAFV